MSLNEDLFEAALFNNPALTGELLFAALDLEDLIDKTPSRIVKKQLKEYTDLVDSKVANIFRSNKSSSPLSKHRHVDGKLHQSIETTIRELNERMEHKLTELIGNTRNSLHWVPDNIFMYFSMTATKAIEYLVSVLPQKPSRSIFGLETNKKFKYADFQVSRFNRMFTVIEDPITVLDDLKNNRVNTHSIETMQLVYPEILENMRSELTNYFIEKRTKDKEFDISFQQKINLAKFFGTDVSEFTDPDYVNKLQGILKISDDQSKGGSQGQGQLSSAQQTMIPSSAIKQRLSQS